MAVVQNPLIGRTKQKFSNAIFTTWKGINVIRSKPLTVANPNSPAQQAARSKFALTSIIGKKALSAIKKGFAKQAIGKSEVNVFVSRNIGAVQLDGGGVPSITDANLKVSEGQLPQLGGFVGTGGSVPNEYIDLTAENLSTVQMGNEVVAVLLGSTPVEEETQIAVVSGTYTGSPMQLDSPFGNDNIVGYKVFQYNPLTREASNSQ